MATGLCSFHNNSGSAQAFSNFRKFGIGNNWNNGNPIFLADGKHISGKAGAGHYQIDFFLCCRSNEPLEFTSGYHSIDANHTLAIGKFPGKADFFAQFIKRQAGSSNEAYTAFIGY